MNKPPKLMLNESDSVSYLPDIKSVKSTSQSPRYILNSSTIIPASFSSALKNSKLENFVITKLNENSKKERSLKIKKSAETVSFKKKYLNLLKLLKEKEDYILQLESRFQETEASSDPKPELEQFTRKTTKNQNKNSEVLVLRQENLELMENLEKNHNQINEMKKKIVEFEKNKEKVKAQVELLEKSLANKSVEGEVTLKKLKDKEKECGLLLEEIEDFERLLKISEDKRKVAIEHSLSKEKKFFHMKTKNFSILHSQVELKASLDDLTRELISKESEIKNLTEQVYEFQEKLQGMQDLNSRLQTELEMIGLTNKNNLNFLQAKLESIEKENKDLKEAQGNNPQHIRSNSKRSETITGTKFLDKYQSQEITRWQQRYFESEEKLIAKTAELEKLKKDGQYLNSQLSGKNSLIGKLSQIIQDSNETCSSQKPPTLNFECLSDIVDQIDKLLKQNEEIFDQFQCSACTGLTNLTLNHPCGHLQCSICQADLPDLCSFCSQKVFLSLQSPHSLLFFSHLKSQTTSYKHLKLLISSSSL